MRGLYKGRYLIAIYDKDDYLIDVLSSPCDSKEKVKLTSIYQYLYRIFSKKYYVENSNYKTRKFYLIDCLEKHDDIFSEEDEIFLDYFKNNSKQKTDADIAKELGISLRTYYRKKEIERRYK